MKIDPRCDSSQSCFRSTCRSTHRSKWSCEAMVALYHWHMTYTSCLLVGAYCESHIQCLRMCKYTDRCAQMHVSYFCMQIFNSFCTRMIQSIVLMHKHAPRKTIFDWSMSLHIRSLTAHTWCVAYKHFWKSIWFFQCQGISAFCNQWATVTSKSPKNVYRDIPGVRCSQGCWPAGLIAGSPTLGIFRPYSRGREHCRW